jgi:hypothetical protein
MGAEQAISGSSLPGAVPLYVWDDSTGAWDRLAIPSFISPATVVGTAYPPGSAVRNGDGSGARRVLERGGDVQPALGWAIYTSV